MTTKKPTRDETWLSWRDELAQLLDELDDIGRQRLVKNLYQERILEIANRIRQFTREI